MARIIMEEKQDRCSHCGVLVGYRADDWHYNEIGHGYEGIKCPNCGRYLDIKWNDLPRYWKETILRINNVQD